MSVGHLYVFFVEVPIQILCLIFNWIVWGFLVSCMITLYILDISSLSDISFVNILFHSVGYLLILLMVSSTV